MKENSHGLLFLGSFSTIYNLLSYICSLEAQLSSEESGEGCSVTWDKFTCLIIKLTVCPRWGEGPQRTKKPRSMSISAALIQSLKLIKYLRNCCWINCQGPQLKEQSQAFWSLGPIFFLTTYFSTSNIVFKLYIVNWIISKQVNHDGLLLTLVTILLNYLKTRKLNLSVYISMD